MFTSPRIPCGRGKHPMIIWILVTILIGLLCQVRDTGAVFCSQCVPREINDPCYYDDSAGGPVGNTEGCLVYQISYVGTTTFHSGGRQALEQNHLDCIRTHTGLDMKDGRCLKTILKKETATGFGGCMGFRNSPPKPGGYQGLDVRICTCKGENCNKAAIWLPDDFTYVEANEAGGETTTVGGVGAENGGGGGDSGGGPAKHVKTAAWSFIITIGLVLFSLCPFQ